MDKFIWLADGEKLPESYVFPPGKRPGKVAVTTSKNVSVIDIGKAEGVDCSEIIQQIMQAGQEFGFFQVINHGVPSTLLDDTRGVFEDFFALKAEEKEDLCSSDVSKNCILLTSNVDFDKEEIHNWRDSLKLICAPLEECRQEWPPKPARFRDIVGDYIIEIRNLGSRILDLICEGLGLEHGYFTKDMSQEQILNVHHYPPCPDPSLTLGTRSHCDFGLLAILLQGDVPGFQVLKDGEWIGVEAIPDAFVVNIGYVLQFVSNGKLLSVEHRVVTNKDNSRISAAFFINPAKECVVQPAKAVVNAENPPIYKTFRWSDGKKLPENYVFPPGKRPGKVDVTTPKNIPVIDIGKTMGLERSVIIQQVMQARQEFGFFQVINHGVVSTLLDDTIGVFEEFFALPADEKVNLCSSDKNKNCLLLTSNVAYDKEEFHNWRDTLRLKGSPLEEHKQEWPLKPVRFSNGKLPSVEHRVVTSKDQSRISSAYFLLPESNCVVEPAEALVNAENPPIYRSVQYSELFNMFIAAYIGEIDSVSGNCKI